MPKVHDLIVHDGVTRVKAKVLWGQPDEIKEEGEDVKSTESEGHGQGAVRGTDLPKSNRETDERVQEKDSEDQERRKD